MTSSYNRGSHACYLGRQGLRHMAPSAPRTRTHTWLVQQLETQPSKAPQPAPPPRLCAEEQPSDSTAVARPLTQLCSHTAVQAV